MNEFRSRSSVDHGRIIISGTGRAGTTFITQLFTNIGFDTGFQKVNQTSYKDGIARAGLEGALLGPSSHYVIKSPFFCDFLEQFIREQKIQVYMAIVPIRRLSEAAESRRKVFNLAKAQGIDPLAQPGTLFRTENPDSQDKVLSDQLYKLMYAMARFEIPFVTPEFPRLILDPGHLYRCLSMVLRDHNVTQNEFLDAHRAIARPSLISKF